MLGYMAIGECPRALDRTIVAGSCPTPCLVDILALQYRLIVKLCERLVHVVN